MTTYYFTTDDYELAYNALDIQPNHVYKTDEKGIYHLLKSIIGDPGRFTNIEDGSFIFLDIDTDLKKIVEIAQENLLNTGFNIPEDFQIPKTETKEEKPESPLGDLKTQVVDFPKHNGSTTLSKQYTEEKNK